jgi:outer membrane protein assembly factor BamD
LRRFPLLFLIALFLFDTTQASAQKILHRKKKVDKSTDTANTAEPDKQLYDKAMEDIKHGRHEVGRLGLQTLINTYPDSEYLAKAKLAIADSFYKEGGTANTTQAIAGYKDFIVFFPFLPEAAYAQMQVAMAHYNEMPKPDRDNTHARNAEEEFQIFLTKYPKDPLAPKGEQRLREVQEVIAEAQFRVGSYYYLKGDRRAAAGRLLPMVRRYPLYSQADTALWMLGDVFEKSERKDVAGFYYAQIVRNYPLSSHAADAKAKLVAFKVPLPQPDPKAVEWMTAEQNVPRPRETILHRSIGALHSGPDVHAAVHSGQPNLVAESESDANTDILKGGNATTALSIGGAPGSKAVVDTVQPGQPAPEGTAPAPSEDVNTPATDSTTPAPAASAPATDPAASSTPAPADGSTSAADANAPQTESTAAQTDATKSDAAAATPPANQKESSSKKKGLKKLVPW